MALLNLLDVHCLLWCSALGWVRPGVILRQMQWTPGVLRCVINTFH